MALRVNLAIARARLPSGGLVVAGPAPHSTDPTSADSSASPGPNPAESPASVGAASASGGDVATGAVGEVEELKEEIADLKADLGGLKEKLGRLRETGCLQCDHSLEDCLHLVGLGHGDL